MNALRYAYAVAAWNSSPTVFVRHDDQLRVLKSLSVLGFHAIELRGGMGRWKSMGRPEHIRLGHGSVDGFREFLAGAGIHEAPVLSWDPTAPAEEDGLQRRSMSDPADRDAILAAAGVYLDFLHELGSEVLVVRASEPAWWRSAPVDHAAIAATLSALQARAAGIRIALDADALSPLPTLDDVRRVLDAADGVGVAVDAGDWAAVGRDPLAAIAEFGDRIAHVRLKNTPFVDESGLYALPAAETAMLQGGAAPHIERWFFELGVPGGRVDVPGILGALQRAGYPGWVTIDSDQSPTPTDTAMLNAWYLSQLPESGFIRTGGAH